MVGSGDGARHDNGVNETARDITARLNKNNREGTGAGITGR